MPTSKGNAMKNKKSELEKIIEDAEKTIKSMEDAKARKRAAQAELHKLRQESHRERLYDIGATVYRIGLDYIENDLIAGFLLRGMEAINKTPNAKSEFQAKGKAALTAANAHIQLEVLIPDRPNRSISGILREAGLRKDKEITRDNKRWSMYSGKASRVYIERRLEGTGAIIKPMTS